ncbi:MAG: DegT/DnrJ/EryC1/StrS aminotransferase [Myxococcales bacterium]|nr:DegT/DnrJ/EryC1/StrS aminotransferase [Myxococcales bacterium]
MAEPHLPVFQPHIGVDTIKAVVDAFDVGWLGMGATTQAFEKQIEAYLGCEPRRVLATNTGTSALHLALAVAGVGPGDEVITPSFNFVADHMAIRACGAEPVLCDIRDDDLGADPASVASLIGPKTKAIIPLHMAGIPCRIDEIYALAREHRLRVIEDATHAFGTRVGGKAIGAGGDLTCFSFDPVKVITSIDGGAVVVRGQEELAVAQQIRILGIDKDTVERYKNTRAWEYDVLRDGQRYHLTNINASIGVSQMKRVDEFISSRQRTCRRYSAAFRGLPGVTLPATDFTDVSPFIYFLRVPAARRLPFIEALRARNIATGIHFLPSHKFTVAQKWRQSAMPVTERVCEEIVTLPLHSNMPDQLADRVIEAVTELLR